MTSLELALVAGVLAAIAAPHVLPLDRVTPLWAAWLWLSGLALRALAAAGLAVFVLVYLPTTDLFRAIAEWCWHDLLPVLAFDLGISGHPLAPAAAIAPALALAASLLWLFGGLVRAWLTLRGRLAMALGEGPRGSTVVDEAQILVGVTRVGRGRIVISHAALWNLDAEELAACLAHEEAHIRRHRPLLLAGSVLGALGRALPGTRAAERELAFQLERNLQGRSAIGEASPYQARRHPFICSISFDCALTIASASERTPPSSVSSSTARAILTAPR